MVGPPLVETVPSLLTERGVADPDPTAVIAAYRQRYRTASIELARAYPGMDGEIDGLAALGRIGVVTSKPLVYARPILAALGLLHRFEVVEGPSTDGHEPKRVTLERALRRLGVAGGPDVVMVGDRSHDIAAGRAHGTTTVGVTWGFGSGADLTTAGADALVHVPADLPTTIAGLTAGPPTGGVDAAGPRAADRGFHGSRSADRPAASRRDAARSDPLPRQRAPRSTSRVMWAPAGS